MLIPSETYSVLETACGVELSFSKLQSIQEKIADISAASRSNRTSSLQLSRLSEPLVTGQYVNVKDVSVSSGTNISPLDPSFLGTYPITSITNGLNISYYQNNLDINNFNFIGELYSVNNIEPRDFYYIQFSVESQVPLNTQVELSPSGYVIGGYQSFVPATTLRMTSEFSTSAKALIKMVVRDISRNTILRNEYLEVVMSNSSNKPCEIISSEPIQNSYLMLNIDNNWTYNHQIYSLAKFLPNIKNENISIRLVKKNEQLLPSVGDNNKIKIIANPNRLSNKKVTIDQIRTSIINQFNSINNSYAIANVGNKSYDIVVEDVLLQPSDLNDIVVAVVPPETGVAIKFSEVATATTYSADIDNIPGISLLYWNHNNKNEYLGELHFDKNIYNNEQILVSYSGNNLTGTIKDFTNGLNYLVSD